MDDQFAVMIPWRALEVSGHADCLTERIPGLQFDRKASTKKLACVVGDPRDVRYLALCVGDYADPLDSLGKGLSSSTRRMMVRVMFNLLAVCRDAIDGQRPDYEGGLA